MKIKMGELNLDEQGDKTMREIIENVIMPDIEKDQKKERDERIKNRKPETYEELIEVLRKEHAETFKDVTLEAQLDKFVDEGEEYQEADDCLNEARELSDMFIVAAGISRFAPRFVEKILIPFLSNQVNKHDDFDKGIIIQLALEKSLINKGRKWSNKGGKLQHK